MDVPGIWIIIEESSFEKHHGLPDRGGLRRGGRTARHVRRPRGRTAVQRGGRKGREGSGSLEGTDRRYSTSISRHVNSYKSNQIRFFCVVFTSGFGQADFVPEDSALCGLLQPLRVPERGRDAESLRDHARAGRAADQQGAEQRAHGVLQELRDEDVGVPDARGHGQSVGLRQAGHQERREVRRFFFLFRTRSERKLGGFAF